MPLKNKRFESIRLILAGIDGVLTDGSMMFGRDGSETMRFHSRDLLGIKLWQKAGGHFGVVSARSSQLVRNLAEEFGVTIVRQGVKDKYAALEKVVTALDLTMEQTCYIGDDLPDLRAIRRSGLGAAPADAAPEIRDAADWISAYPGGNGAVRELIETILKSQNLWSVAAQEFADRV